VLAHENAFVDVRLQLPLVDRMRLRDVDERERRLLPKRLVEARDVAGPATERRSGVAAEDEDERSPVQERVERDGATVLGVEELERRETVTDSQPLRPAVAEKRREHGRAQLRVVDARHVLAVLRVHEEARGEIGAGAHALIVEIG
jgi:hypothetical protein